MRKDIMVRKMTETAKKVTDIIKNNAKFDDDIKMTTLLVDDMGFTSIELVSMIYELETEFDIMLDMEELEFDKINLVENLVTLIERKVSNV